MEHKAGFVGLIGKPNAGKSSLLNALIGEKLAIISPKVSTTRHRIMGIENGDTYQVVYSDTPGIIEPGYKLHEGMMEFVKESLEDSDVLLLIVDCTEPTPDLSLLDKISRSDAWKIVVLNKIDLSNQEEVAKKMELWKEAFKADDIFPVSALHGFNVRELHNKIVEKLPLHPPFFPKDQISDRMQRFFVAEIIREKIFEIYEKEIPYATEVIITQYQESDTIDRIYAEIWVDRSTQKPIVIGSEGRKIKALGIKSRKDIETFVEKKVFLDLRVKVVEGWRKNENMLKRLGFNVEK